MGFIMNIALFSTEYPGNGFKFFGGIGSYTYGLAHALSKKHDVTVFTYGWGPNYLDKNVEIVPIGGFRQNYVHMINHINYSFLLNKFIKKYDFDVLEVPHNNYPGLIPSLSSKIPMVLKLHGIIPIELSKKMRMSSLDRIRRLHLSKLNIIPYKRADMVTSPTQFAADIALKDWGARDIKIVPNGIDLNFFKKSDLTKEELLNIDNDSPLVFYAGLLDFTKGTDLVLKAAEYVIDRYKNAIFAFAGKDSEFRNTSMQTWIRKTAIEKGISENIKIIGSLKWNELSKYYSVADLTCFPSRFDNFPNVVLESLACGTPVVGSNVSGIAEMIDDSCGRLTSLEPIDIANAILELISAGKKSYEEGIKQKNNYYSWDNIAKLTEKVYKSI